jgi:hypothetical protein
LVPVIRAPAPRRFPPPWTIEEHTESFCITDAAGQALAYVYFEEEKGRRDVMHRLTKDEARRIAANIAKLPQLLRGPKTQKSAASPEGPAARATICLRRCGEFYCGLFRRRSRCNWSRR